jgi:hypothetical protein
MKVNKKPKASVKKVRVAASKPKKRPRTRARASMKGWGSVAGTAIGGYLGGPAGAAMGHMVGGAAGSLISKVTGFGQYKVNSNSLINGNSVPTFKSDADGMIVCHREFIADVVGSVDFVLQKYPINPGLANMFPLLSQMSRVFEEYEMSGLVLEYRPSSGSAISSVSSALGVVILATDYDAANPTFTNKQQMESYEFSNSTVPFTGCLHPVECARNRNVLDNLYVRLTPPETGTDIRLYDMGNFQIATQGMQSIYTVGELWVTYDVRLKKPRLPGVVPELVSPFMRMITLPPGTSTSVNLFGSNAALTTDSNTGYFGVFTGPGEASGTFYLKKKGFYFLFLGVDTSATPTGSSAYLQISGSLGSNLAYRNYFAGNTRPAFPAFQPYLALGVPPNIASTCSMVCVECLADGSSGANAFYVAPIDSGWTSGSFDVVGVWLGTTVNLTSTLPLPPSFTMSPPAIIGLPSKPVPIKVQEPLETKDDIETCRSAFVKVFMTN